MKYPSQKILTIIVFSLIGLLWTAVALMEPRSEDWLTDLSLILTFLAIFVLGFTVGTYGTYSENRLRIVQFFVFRKEISINEITWIGYRPTWKFQPIARSLYIVQEINGVKCKSLEFKNSIFSEKTLAQITKDLKVSNPTIALDDPAKSLLKTTA